MPDPAVPDPASVTRPGRARRRAARPGRGAPRQGRPAGGWLPYLLVLIGCGGGLWWVSRGGGHGARGGTLTVAGAFFLAALARLVLPESRAGMLASRTRITDVVTFAVLAAGLLAAGLMLQT